MEQKSDIERQTSAHKKRVLKERAKLYAKTEKRQKDHGLQVQGLEFKLSDENYIISTQSIVEVIPLKDMTVLPCTPAIILGIINVRGRILSVVNIKTFLNLPDKGLASLNRVIILKDSRIELGILVDEVIGKVDFHPRELKGVSSINQEIAKEFVMGVTKERAIVLDIEKFMNDKSLIIDEEVY